MNEPSSHKGSIYRTFILVGINESWAVSFFFLLFGREIDKNISFSLPSTQNSFQTSSDIHHFASDRHLGVIFYQIKQKLKLSGMINELAMVCW